MMGASSRRRGRLADDINKHGEGQNFHKNSNLKTMTDKENNNNSHNTVHKNHKQQALATTAVRRQVLGKRSATSSRNAATSDSELDFKNKCKSSGFGGDTATSSGRKPFSDVTTSSSSPARTSFQVEHDTRSDIVTSTGTRKKLSDNTVLSTSYQSNSRLGTLRSLRQSFRSPVGSANTPKEQRVPIKEQSQSKQQEEEQEIEMPMSGSDTLPSTELLSQKEVNRVPPSLPSSSLTSATDASPNVENKEGEESLLLSPFPVENQPNQQALSSNTTHSVGQSEEDLLLSPATPTMAQSNKQPSRSQHQQLLSPVGGGLEETEESLLLSPTTPIEVQPCRQEQTLSQQQQSLSHPATDTTEEAEDSLLLSPVAPAVAKSDKELQHRSIRSSTVKTPDTTKRIQSSARKSVTTTARKAAANRAALAMKRQASARLLAQAQAPTVKVNRTNGGVSACMDLSSMFTNARGVSPESSSHMSEQPQKLSSQPKAMPVAKKAATPIIISVPPISRSQRIKKTASSPTAIARKAATTSITNVRGAPFAGKKVVSTSTTNQHRVVVTGKEVHDWAEKQCDAFAAWLNYTLEPDEEKEQLGPQQQHTGPATSKTLQSAPPPSHPDREAALATLVAHQRSAGVRRNAVIIFQAPSMSHARNVLYNEIVQKRLSIRKDYTNLAANVACREKLTDLLMSYTEPWLQVGLETMCGKSLRDVVIHGTTTATTMMNKSHIKKSRNCKKTITISAKTTSSPPASRRKRALRQAIFQWVLSDEVLLRKYTKGRCNMPSGRFEKAYLAEMRDLVLYRIFVLVVFLDHAKEANLLESTPRLFCKDAGVKSTRDVLLSVSRDFLAGQGDVCKHLHRAGLKKSTQWYKQEPTDELEFNINNLAVDLRDGVILGRLTEILTRSAFKSTLSKLRLPSSSRLRWLHNVNVSLARLRHTGVPLHADLAAHHVVDGHRDKVLQLLWTVIAHCSLAHLLNPDKVEKEIRRIERQRSITKMGAVILSKTSMSPASSQTTEEKLCLLLLRWCQVICAQFGLEVHNMTVDFADGRAFCLLIHYYHPNLLQISEILSTTTSPNRIVVKNDEDVLRANEQKNSALANTRMSEIGGIPKMIPISDTQNVPEEKTVLLCLACMCSRLMESKIEVWSCLLIQNRYRRYRRAVLYEKQLTAANVIWNTWRERRPDYYEARNRRFGPAVKTIERFVLKHRAALKQLRLERVARENHDEAAICIQKHVRGLVTRKKNLPVLRSHLAAKLIQSRWRGSVARGSFHNLVIEQNAALTLQRVWKWYRRQLQIENLAAVQVQRIFRGWFWRLQYHIDRLDVIDVQKCARRYLARKKYTRRLSAILVLQCGWRKYFATKMVLERQQKIAWSSSITIQAHWRMFAAKCAYKIIRQKVILCQSHVRKLKAEYIANNRRNAVVLLQCARRQQIARRYLRMQSHDFVAATILQRYWRGTLARRKLAIMLATKRQNAIISIQKTIRRYAAIQQVAVLKKEVNSAAIILQGAWRRFRAFTRFRIFVHDLITVQAIVRRQISIRQSARRRAAILCIQQFFRQAAAVQLVRWLHAEKIAREYLLCVKQVQNWYRQRYSIQLSVRRRQAVLRLQATARAFLSRIRFAALRKKWRQLRLEEASATLIQCAIRSFISIQRKKQHLSSCRIQKVWRGYTAFTKFSYAIASAVSIQCHFRRYLCVRLYQNVYHSVILIQASVRRSLARAWMFRMTKSATKLQALARKRSVLSIFCLQKKAATTIQRWTKGHLQRIHLEMEHYAACEIQRIWRGYDVFADYVWRFRSAVTIQTFLRVIFAKRFVQSYRMDMKAAQLLRVKNATKIQRCYREYTHRVRVDRAALIVTRAATAYLLRLSFIRLRRIVNRCQARFRGRSIRRLRSKRLRIIASRVQRANSNAKANPSLRLGNLTREALQVLLHSKRLTEIMIAVRQLETATALSEACCITLVNAGAPSILFSLVHTCNRSEPHKELVYHILLIMSNVARNENLLPSVATHDWLEVFLDKVQIFRDKEGIFCVAVSLIARVVQSCQEMKKICGSYENLKVLKLVHGVCISKLPSSGGIIAPASKSRYRCRTLNETTNKHSKNDPCRRHGILSQREGVKTLGKIIRFVES